MLKDIVEVKYLQNYQIYLKFEDGVEGIVDIKKLIEFKDIFAPLQNLDYFKTVQINSEWGTIYWENGADLDPDVLYSIVTGKVIPNYQFSKA